MFDLRKCVLVDIHGMLWDLVIVIRKVVSEKDFILLLEFGACI